MSKTKDVFEAAKAVSNILESFDSVKRKNIIRWSMENLNDSAEQEYSSNFNKSYLQNNFTESKDQNSITESKPMDIKSFINSKNPKNDVHLATTIAYYYAFEAPLNKKKSTLNADDLIEAVRKSQQKRFQKPSQVLNNAKTRGYLDQAEERGHFQINSVGENLVAMVLPGKTKTPLNNKKRNQKKRARKR